MSWERRIATILWNNMKDQKCGAKERDGSVCQRPPALPFNSRCRLHGGLSTGPTTDEGKARISEAQKSRWARWRVERGLTQVKPRKPCIPVPLPVSGSLERLCPDPNGLFVEEDEDGNALGVTAEIWDHGNKRHRLARMKAIAKNLSILNWGCRYCGEPVPIYRRADARFCRERCRKASARERKKAFL